MRFDWKIALGFSVSAFFLWWAFRGEDLVGIVNRIREADFWLLLASVSVGTAGYLIRAFRWKLLLAPLGVRTTLRARWESIIIGFTVTNIWPARIGEIIRPIALSRMSPVSASGALGTVILERVVDAIALLILLGFTLAAPAFPTDATVVGQPVSLVVSLLLVGISGILAALTLMIFKPNLAISGLRPVFRLLPAPIEARAKKALESLLQGMELLRQPRALFATLLWSLFLWLWMASSIWLAFRAFDLRLGFAAAMFTQCAVAVFVALPAAPGFIGTFEAGVRVALVEIYGVGSEVTLSVATAYHIAGFIPVTLLGIWYAWRMGLNVREVRAEQVEAS